MKQRTLKNVVKASGIAVHSGERAELTFCPAPVNTGIIFERVDLTPSIDIPALSQFVGDTTLNTSLSKEGIHVSTIEHLMSALAGLGIDNLRIQIDAPELPVMDGSAAPFVFLLQSAGIVEQKAQKKFIRIRKKISFQKDDKSVSLEPYDGFKVAFTLDYDHPVFQTSTQSLEMDLSNSSYVKEISRARTFGFLADYEQMQAMNLGKGAGLDNAIVIDDFRVLNQDGLRYEDEFVKHKVLDAIGDLYLCGGAIIGSFKGYKSGHAMNNQLLQKLMQTADAWEYVSYKNVETSPVKFLRPALVST